MDLLTGVHGLMNVLHHLIADFVECGHVKKARKIMEVSCRLDLDPLSVLNHRIDCSDTGNGGLAQKKKQTNKKKTRPTGGACELLT